MTTRITFDDVVNDKKISDDELKNDINKLKKLDASENKRCFAGNNFLYHFQMVNLSKVSIKGKPSLYDIMKDDDLYKKLYDKMIKLNRTGSIPNRLFEAERFNNAVVFFKASTAKYLYKKYKATSVLDPTAGWGGRMLGANALNIKYTGIDTNINLKDTYDQMLKFLNDKNLQMIFQDCLSVDFNTIDYDFVLTSPPYINLEIYEHMTPYSSKKAYYELFLIPLITKCLKHIKSGGKVAFNISPDMYSDLQKFGFRKCDIEEDLLQQKRLSKTKEDKIYIWINSLSV
jgi:hypothetical protein